MIAMVNRKDGNNFPTIQQFWKLDTDEGEEDIETEATRLKKIMADAKERMIKK